MKNFSLYLVVLLLALAASCNVVSAHNNYYDPIWTEDGIRITPYQGQNSDGSIYFETIKFEIESSNSQYNFSMATTAACAGVDYLNSLAGYFPWLMQKNEIDIRDAILMAAAEHPDWKVIRISMTEEDYNRTKAEKGDIFYYPDLISACETIKLKEYQNEKIIRIEVVNIDSYNVNVSITGHDGDPVLMPTYVPDFEDVAYDCYSADIVLLNNAMGLKNIPFNSVKDEIKRQMDAGSYIVLLSSSDFVGLESPAIAEEQGYTIIKEADGSTRLYITNEEELKTNLDLAIDQLGESRGKKYEGEERETIKKELEYRITIITEDNKELEEEKYALGEPEERLAISELLFESYICV